MRLGRLVCVSLVGLLLVAGCGSEGGPPSAPGYVAKSPLYLSIPKLGISSTLVSLDQNPDHTLEVPPLDTPQQAGWYARSAVPGRLGTGEVKSAIILGHVDGKGRPGVFLHLATLIPQDRFTVILDDGTETMWQVTEVHKYSKKKFPTDAVYRQSSEPTLRLITCGGALGGDGHYTDNVVVSAKLVT